MHSTTVETAIKMLESLPAPAQEQVVDHLRHYIADLVDDHTWEERFAATQSQLVAAARRAKEQIGRGESTPLDAGLL